MSRKRHTLEQIISKLREAEVGSASNSMAPLRRSPQCNSQRRGLRTLVAILATTLPNSSVHSRPGHFFLTVSGCSSACPLLATGGSEELAIKVSAIRSIAVVLDIGPPNHGVALTYTG